MTRARARASTRRTNHWPNTDLDRERRLLGQVLSYPDRVLAAVRGAGVEPETFARAAHQTIWRTVRAEAAAGREIDLVSIVAGLRRAGDLDAVGGPAYVSALVDGQPRWTPAAADQHARDLVQLARHRALSAHLRAVGEAIDASDGQQADAIRSQLGEALAAFDGVQTNGRHVRLTAADTIAVRPVHWLYTTPQGFGRLPLGVVALIGGREGVGKTTYAYTLAAAITRGRLPGAHFGAPKDVIVAATEDSWAHTIVPRFMAAGADLARVHRVDVETGPSAEAPLTLPRDVDALAAAIRQVGAVLVILDPLLSRLDAKLDSHKDAEVRVALEPLVAVADATGATMLGLIHVNKSTSSDALSLLMGSRAFAAVARAVLFVMTDPDDETVRLVGQAKNNLGRLSLPTLRFQVVEATVTQTDEGPVKTGKLEWLGESDRSIREVLEVSGETDRTATAEAADWLSDYLAAADGPVASQAVKKAGQGAGHALAALNRARAKLKVHTEAVGFPRQTFWTLPQSSRPSRRSPGETATTETTETTEAQPVQSSQSSQSSHTPRARDNWKAEGYGDF